ncbi:MAG: hypothetical protein ACK4E0_02080 [Chitinophagaceae bacterium]
MKLILSLLFLITIASVSAQAYESSATYDKKKQKTVSMDYAHSQEAVENAVLKKMESLGFRAKVEKGLFNKDKGFIVFSDVLLDEVTDTRYDYIVKVERKSRREKDETTLNVLINKNGEDVIPALDGQTLGRMKLFLTNLIPDIEEAALELQIKAQDELVIKAEKRFKDLQDEKADLEKKLQKNADDIERQQKEIEAQRVLLEEMKGRRRSALPVEAKEN